MQQAPVVLPYDIQLKKIPDGSAPQSRLKLVNGEVPFDAAGEAPARAIQAFVAVLVEVAIELNDPRVTKALRTAVSDFADYLVIDGD
jgi:hypothetical protein